MQLIHVKRIAQYWRVPPLGRTISLALIPFPVDNSIPEEEEFYFAVLFIQQNRSGGPYGVRAEHLQ